MSPLEILNVYELSICLPLVMDNVCFMSQFLYWPLLDTSVPQSWEYCPQELLVQRDHVHPKMGVQESNPFPSRWSQWRRNSYFKFLQWDHFEACLHLRLNSCLVFTSPTNYASSVALILRALTHWTNPLPKNSHLRLCFYGTWWAPWG